MGFGEPGPQAVDALRVAARVNAPGHEVPFERGYLLAQAELRRDLHRGRRTVQQRPVQVEQVQTRHGSRD